MAAIAGRRMMSSTPLEVIHKTTIAVQLHFPYRFFIDAASSAERIGRTGLPDKLKESGLGGAICH
jgi:hypothetical protein